MQVARIVGVMPESGRTLARSFRLSVDVVEFPATSVLSPLDMRAAPASLAPTVVPAWVYRNMIASASSAAERVAKIPEPYRSLV